MSAVEKRKYIKELQKQGMSPSLNYDVQFYCDEKGLGIYCLKFNYRNQEYGTPHIGWVAEDEYIEKEIREDEVDKSKVL